MSQEPVETKAADPEARARKRRPIVLLAVLSVIALHGVVRWQALDHHRATVSRGFYHAAINYGAGKGFVQDAGFQRSAELNQFHDYAYLDRDTRPAVSESGGLFDRVDTWTEYELDSEKNDLVRLYPTGLRLVIGWLWRAFGFSWAYVIALNLVFSLLALLALMDIGRRLGGAISGIFAGLLFSIASPEVLEFLTFGRDGMPLWCGVLLAWVWIRVVPEPPERGEFEIPAVLRFLGGGALVGIVLWISAETRSSNVYFVPLSMVFAAVYAALLAKSAWARGTRSAVGRGVVGGSILIVLFTTTFIGLRSATDSMAGISSEPVSGTMHRIYAGLGRFNQMGLTELPNQAQFDDRRIYVKALEYSRRVLGREEMFGYLTEGQDDALARCYADNVRQYPHSMYLGFRRAFERTFFELEDPTDYFRFGSDEREEPRAFLRTLDRANKNYYRHGDIAILALVGFALALFRPRSQRAVLMLLGFALLNATVAGIQFMPRHVLMGHFVYWIGAGLLAGHVAIGVRAAFGRRSAPEPGGEEVAPLFEFVPGFRRVAFTAALGAVGWGLATGGEFILERVEAANVREVIANFNAREPVAAPFAESFVARPVPANASVEPKGSEFRVFELDPSIEAREVYKLPTYALVVEFGRVPEGSDPRSAVTFSLRPESPDGAPSRYRRRFEIPAGNDVRALWPVYHAGERYTIEVESDLKIVRTTWISLDDWKREIWEGIYDADAFLNP